MKNNVAKPSPLRHARLGFSNFFSNMLCDDFLEILTKHSGINKSMLLLPPLFRHVIFHIDKLSPMLY